MRIAVINDYMKIARSAADWSRVDAIATVDHFSEPLGGEDAVASVLEPYDVVVTERDRTAFPAALFARLPKLRLLVATGPVNFAIDLAAAAERHVTVCYTDAVMGATPEVAWGLILALSRGIAWNHWNVRNGGWQKAPGFGLAGKTLGLLGLGTVGKQMVRIADSFGMRTLAWSQNLDDERARVAGTIRVERDALLAAADVVSIHLVLSERTRGLVGREAFARMKRGAYLVNTSRGPIVDEAALIAALGDGTLAGAGLDVFDIEPLPRDHPLRTLGNVVLSPHVGYITDDQCRLFYGQVVENILAFAAGTPVRVMTRPMMV